MAKVVRTAMDGDVLRPYADSSSGSRRAERLPSQQPVQSGDIN